jgi:hypothetical protein
MVLSSVLPSNFAKRDNMSPDEVGCPGPPVALAAPVTRWNGEPSAMTEERTLPKQPKRPIVANPATPGVQTPNKPDGRDAPPTGETRTG